MLLVKWTVREREDWVAPRLPEGAHKEDEPCTELLRLSARRSGHMQGWGQWADPCGSVRALSPGLFSFVR